MLQWQSATTLVFLEFWWFDLAWVSQVCVCLCVQRPEVASVYAFHGWNAMAGKQNWGWKEGHVRMKDRHTFTKVGRI